MTSLLLSSCLHKKAVFKLIPSFIAIFFRVIDSSIQSIYLSHSSFVCKFLLLYSGDYLIQIANLPTIKGYIAYFNPIGAHESGLIGEDPNGIPNNLLPYVAQVAIGKLDKLTIYGNDYNTKDGTGVGYSVLDIVKAFEKASNKIVSYEIGPRRAGDIASCYAEPSFALKELGWKATRDLDTICVDAWR